LILEVPEVIIEVPMDMPVQEELTDARISGIQEELSWQSQTIKMLREDMDQQSQTIRELRQYIEELIEELRQTIEEQRKTIQKQEGAPPHIQVAEKQGGLANRAVGAKGKMTAQNKSGIERVGPWLLFLFLAVYFHQMEAIPRRNHGWKVGGSSKCPLIEVVDEEKSGESGNVGGGGHWVHWTRSSWKWPCNCINSRSFVVGVWYCANSVKYSTT